MPEIKNTFLGGKMNKDLDERLLPKNEYRDALNVEVSTSQGDDVGALQNTWGNTVQSNLSDIISGGKCIGSIVSKEKDKIYWFIKGDDVDAIAEYDIKLRNVSPVLVDYGMEDTYIQSFTSTTLNPNAIGSGAPVWNEITIWDSQGGWSNASPESHGTEGKSWDITGGNATAVWGRAGNMRLFVDEINLIEGYEYEIEYEVTILRSDQESGVYLTNHGPKGENVRLDVESSGVKKTRWVQGDYVGGSGHQRDNAVWIHHNSLTANNSAFSIDNIRIRQVNRFLNFEDVEYITGINILDGMLFWTDGQNEPKKINIERCKAGSYDITNFSTTTFVGPELVNNGSFTGNANGWTNSVGTSLPNAGWDYNSNNIIAVSVTSGKAIHDRNANIKRGKTYQITFDISSWTGGAIKPVLVDEYSSRTIMNTSISDGVDGTKTFIITTGLTNDTHTVYNLHTAYTYASGFYLICDWGPLNCIIDNISVKEIAFDWNRTTKVKDATGSYTRNITEEDITLIKKYPLNAPNMRLFSTTKPEGSVIDSFCETTYNTTYNYGTPMLDGSGDTIRWMQAIQFTLAKDAIGHTHTKGITPSQVDQLVQIDISNAMLASLDSNTLGSTVQHPLYLDDKYNPADPTRWKTGNSLYVDNSFTNQEDYHKHAWQMWCSINEHFPHHVWLIRESGGLDSGYLVNQDKIGGRLYVRMSTNRHTFDDQMHDFKKGSRITVGSWGYNNNASFWTYKNEDDEIVVKPPGTKAVEYNHGPDGKIITDSQGTLFEPSIINPEDHYTNSVGKFGSGWSGDGNRYIGNISTTTTTQHGAIYPSPGVALNVNGSGTDGYQYLHDVVQGLQKGYTYTVRAKFTIIDDQLNDTTRPAAGFSHLNARDSEQMSTTNLQLSHTASHGGSTNIYIINKNFEARSTGTLSLFKRNGVSVIVSELQCRAVYSNPIRINPLVFSPKPDYEVGDLVKMTNVKKAPNGDDINVVVKLNKEINNAFQNIGTTDQDIKSWKHKTDTQPGGGGNWVTDDGERAAYPETWADGHAHSTTWSGTENCKINDPDFRVSTSSYLTAIQGGDGGDLSFSGGTTDLNDGSTNTADWTTGLQMIKNGSFNSAEPSDSNKLSYWYEVYSDASGSEDLGSWEWNQSGEVQINNPSASSTVGSGPAKQWANIQQINFGDDTTDRSSNDRLFFEPGGEYKYRFTVSNVTGTSGAGMFIRLYNNWGYAQTATTNTGTKPGWSVGDGSSDDQYGVITFRDWVSSGENVPAGWKESALDDGINRNKVIFHVNNPHQNDTSHADHERLDTCTLARVYVWANNNINRVNWGTNVGGGMDVITGTTAQIVSYPARADGVRGAGTGTFKLVEGNYYRMDYKISSTNYVSCGFNIANPVDESLSGSGCYIALWKHCAHAMHNLLGNYKQEGLTYLDVENGTHTVYWQQDKDANQLSILLGRGFAGNIDDIEVYDVTVTKTDMGKAGSNDIRKMFNAEIVSIDSSLAQLPPEDHTKWECELLDEEPIFKKVFPRFAYRWKYKDGEYSAISAFTEVAFVPDNDYKYDAKDGYNLAMENQVRRVILDDFDTMPHDVVELDILYKESNSNSIYTFTTIKGSDLDNFSKYEITKEKYHALVESKQLLRPYDNIPRKAKAQEISANRIIFGNYTQQYDITPSDEPTIEASLISQGVQSAIQSRKTIKSIREYQVGISYLDKYGRQSPVFSSENGLIQIDQKNAKDANSIIAGINNFPPDWVTHYKYYIKDNAASYYNISLDRFWQAEESNHVWLSFPSSDFNKLSVDDYLILKKGHDTDKALAPLRTAKYKILAKQGNAPEFIKMVRKSIGGRIYNTDGKGLHFFTQTSYNGNSGFYPSKNKTTFRLKGSVVHANNAFKEAVIDDQTGRYIRIGKQSGGRASYFSKYYEILHISRTMSPTADSSTADVWNQDDAYYEFTLVEPFDDDISFVGTSYTASRKLFIEYYREEIIDFDNAYEGKFFVKIAKDAAFDTHVGQKQKIEDSGYNIINAQDAYWAHVYENSANNTNADKGQDTDDWLWIRRVWGTDANGDPELQAGNFDFHVSSDGAGYDATTLDGAYNGSDVAEFPAVLAKTIDITASGASSATTWDNPYTQDWTGTWRKEDWGKQIDGSVPQRFCIDQSWSWNWSTGNDAYNGYKATEFNSRIGHGFIIGNSWCSFKFAGIGEIDEGTDNTAGSATDGGTNTEPDPSSSDIDTNTWNDAGDGELSAQWFDNHPLLQSLITEGTQFKWQDDPSETVYTILEVKNKGIIQNYDHKLPNGRKYGTSIDGYILDKSKENFGYRIDLILNKTIVWSPTATIGNGTGYNTDGTHSPLTAFTDSAAGTTSQIQIVEKRPSEKAYTSFNPAVFEIEPKERVDLNLYYETPETGMVLQDGMYIEALNNTSVNDEAYNVAGGNYFSDVNAGTIYKPGGSYALPYAKIFGDEMLDNSDFATADSGTNTGAAKWTINDTPNITATHDATNHRLEVIKPNGASGSFNNLQYDGDGTSGGDLITFQDGATYEILLDIEHLDNDENNYGGTPESTKLIVRGHDGSAWTSYYPLNPGVNWQAVPPSTSPTKHTFQFTWDSSQTGASGNQAKIFIELTDSTTNYKKKLILNNFSLKKVEYDETKPVCRIIHGEGYDWMNSSSRIFRINKNTWDDAPLFPEIYTPGQDLPLGITIRLSKRDQSGRIKYYKDYLLPTEQFVADNPENIFIPLETLKWHNAFAFGNGVESNRLRDDFNAVTIDKGPRVSTTLEETYKEEYLGSGLIFSGIYNSTSSVNKLNQFIAAESITKSLNPEYGSIQKLFTRNTNIVAFCEDKILKVLANKDALYNADGSVQMTATDKVLGQAIPFVGEYGISRNPESFANFGYRVYFTDRDRGAVLRLSADGLTPISDKDMISYFKYNLPNNNTMIGSYDENRDTYNLTLDETTVSFSEKVNGWTSFKSFLAESGTSINGEYYTFKNGDIWKHHTNALRNNFYNTQYESTVKFMFNDLVDEIKNFNTINYEGSTSRLYEKETGQENQLLKSGWYTDSIITDLESAEVASFKEREGKWFNNITGITKTETDIDIKDFTSQGLGVLLGISTSHANYKTLSIKAITPSSEPEVDAVTSGSGVNYNPGSGTVVDFNYPEDTVYLEDTINNTTGITVENATQISWIEHTANTPQDTDGPGLYYITNIIGGLQRGNRYYIEAEIENYSGSATSGFYGANMVDGSAINTAERNDNGKIYRYFTYNDNKYSQGTFGEQGEGIHFYKSAETSGTVKNIKCINITPKVDDVTFVVNTSSTDRTQTTTEIKTNKEVGSTGLVATTHDFYIHSQTVNGLKYAVAASQFQVRSSNDMVEVGTITDLGAGTSGSGYYANVVKIPITVNYGVSSDPFPDFNIESYLNIIGEPTLAIDQ
tara:strand:- start:9529 stop:19719 length:10191 start_codon:yes stop_codon:yes gene_type:complete